VQVDDVRTESWAAIAVTLLLFAVVPAFTRSVRGASLFAAAAALVAALAIFLPWYSEVWGGSETNHVPSVWSSRFRAHARVSLDGLHWPFFGVLSLPLAVVAGGLGIRHVLHDRDSTIRFWSLAPAFLLLALVILGSLDVALHAPTVHSDNYRADYDIVWTRAYGLGVHVAAGACGALWSFVADRRRVRFDAEARSNRGRENPAR